MQLGKSGTNFTKKAGQRSIIITDEDHWLREYSENQLLNYKYVTIWIQLCSIYLENNLFLAHYFTLVNSSVTLVNNYTTSMANSNVTTESGGRQNMFPTETRPYIDESVSYDSYPQNAEKVNGRWAMIGLVALVGAYVSTGQIIPGIF